jgi:methyltransferase
MKYVFIIMLFYIVAQRIMELVISRKNEKWMLSNGAVEYGRSHYKYIVVLHTSFIVSLITEYILVKDNNGFTEFNNFLLLLFSVLQVLRFYTMYSLGKYWNVKILRIPGTPLVKTGIYKYVKHPNYLIVAAEILIIPLILGCYFTAVIFSALNLLALSARIKAENFALKQ